MKIYFCFALIIFVSFIFTTYSSCSDLNISNSTRLNEQYSSSSDGSLIIDDKTSLIWQRCVAGMRWDGNSCSGQATAFTYSSAMLYASKISRVKKQPELNDAINIAIKLQNEPNARSKALPATPHNYWRLPTIKELLSIVQKSRINPAIDVNIFPSTPPDCTWSSTPYAGYSTFNNYAVNFLTGNFDGFERSRSCYVRLVKTSNKKSNYANNTGQITEHPKVSRKVTIQFVPVDAGCFLMSNHISGNKPLKTCVNSFNIGKYEITQGQWKKVMGSNPSYFSNCGDNCPVENVSLNDVNQFIKRLSALDKKVYRLPTNAEWEYACLSGGKHETFCGGNDPDAVGWHMENSNYKSHIVGLKNPNHLGIYDMSGNVSEIVSDDLYSNNNRSHAFGRICRGGDWKSSHTDNNAIRQDCVLDTHGSKLGRIGFRIAF